MSSWPAVTRPSSYVAGNARDKVARVRRDAGVYLSNLAARRSDVRTFSVICNSRTGSTLLCDLLNSHPQIECEDEILKTWRDFPFLFVRGSAARARRRGFSAYGFKLNTVSTKLMPVREDILDRFVRQLAASGFMFIRLRRRNVVRQALSVLRAAETVYHQRGPGASTAGPIHVDVAQLFQLIAMLERHDEVIGKIVDSHSAREFWYEYDLEDAAAQQATVDRIAAHLEIDPAPVSTDLRRFAPARLEEAVTNFDEIAEHLRSTKYEQFLEA